MTMTADAAPGSTCPTARSPSRSARPLAGDHAAWSPPRPSRAAAAAASRHPARSCPAACASAAACAAGAQASSMVFCPGSALPRSRMPLRHRLHHRDDVARRRARLALDRRRRPHQRRGVERPARGADRVQERLRRGVQHRRRLRAAAPARRPRRAPPRSRAPWRCRGRRRRSPRRAGRARPCSPPCRAAIAAIIARSAAPRRSPSPHPEHRAVAGMIEHRRQLGVEMHAGHRGAGHLERGAPVADPGRVHPEPGRRRAAAATRRFMM